MNSGNGNTSGIRPTEYKVLIRKKEIETKSKGGIIIPETTQEKEKYAMMYGEIIAVSHLAFTYASDAEWEGKKPRVGDWTLIGKYSGVNVRGIDGQEYTLVNDKDVIAMLEEKP